MKHFNRLEKLLFEYTALSQSESVPNLEKTVYQELADFCIYLKKYSLGLEVVDSAIQIYPFTPDFLVKKSEILLLLNKPQQALSVLSDIDHLASLSRTAQLLRAKALSATGQNKEALDLLGQLDNEKKNDFSVYQLQASIFEKMQQFENLYQVTKSQIFSAPKEQIEELLDRHLFFTEITSNHSDAISFLNKVIDIYPFSSTAWGNLGTAHKTLGECFEATDAFEYAIAIDPTNKSAYFQTAECLESIDEYDKAINYYLEYLNNINYRDPDAIIRLSHCYIKTNQNQQAIALLQQTIDTSPELEEAYHLLGVALLSYNPKSALKNLHKAVVLNPNNEIFVIELANAYFLLGDNEKALEYYQESIIIAPDLMETWYPFIKFLFVTEQFEQLEDSLEELSSFFNIDQYIYYKIAFLIQTGKREEAKYWLAEALTIDFKAHSLLFEFIPNLAQDGEIIKVIEQYRT